MRPFRLAVAPGARRQAWLRTAAGERFAELELNVYPSRVSPQITDDGHGALRAASDGLFARNGTRMSEEELRHSPHIWIGSLDGLVEKAVELRAELGITSFMTGEVDELSAVVERLAGT